MTSQDSGVREARFAPPLRIRTVDSHVTGSAAFRLLYLPYRPRNDGRLRRSRPRRSPATALPSKPLGRDILRARKKEPVGSVR